MNQAMKKHIIREESARFLDSQFGGLDLSGSPDLTKPPSEKFEPCDKDGLNRVDLSGLPVTNKLKTFLQAPDRETLAEVARSDPQAAEQLRSVVADDIAREFVQRNPDYIPTDQNVRRIVALLTKQYLQHDLDYFDDEDDAINELMAVDGWTVATVEWAYNKLLQDGLLDVPANQLRYLTESDRLKCAQLAANGDALGSIVAYINARLGQDVADEIAFALDEPFAFTANPEYRPMLEEATWFAFENSRHDYTPTPERREYMKRYIAGRFMTLALLDAAWESCKRHEQDVARGAILGQLETRAAEPQQDLDALTDQQIDSLYRSTLRQIAQDSRGAGIYQ